MSLTTMLYIGNDGAMAAQGGLSTTGQNVTNATTPGYVKRDPILETRAGTASGLYYGGVDRKDDRFTLANVVSQSGSLGKYTAQDEAMTNLQSLFAIDGQTPIATDVNSLFKAFQALSGNPDDTSARQLLLQQGQTLASDLNTASDGLAKEQANDIQKIGGLLGDTNQKLKQLGALNVAISQALALGQDSSTLQDQREQIITALGTSIGATGIVNDKGSMTVFACGMTLIDNGSVTTLSSGQNAASGQVQVFATSPSGSTQDITSGVVNGKLAGYLTSHNTDIPTIRAQLDQFAYDFATAINNVHSTGYGLDGSTGNNFFDIPTTATGAAHQITMNATLLSNTNKIAASSTAGGLPGGNDLAIQLSDISVASIGSGGSPSERIADLVGTIGTMSSSANSSKTLFTNTLSQAQTMRDSATGVNMQEELTNLTKFQNAYEASVRVLQTANTLMQDVMNLIQ